jgi:hypothetical protein
VNNLLSEVPVKQILLRSISLLALTLSIVGCGKADKNDENESDGGTPNLPVEQVTETPSISFAVTSFTSLPTCNDSRRGSLAYVRDMKKFYTCEAEGWSAEPVSTESQSNGSKITGKWKFHVDSYVGEPELAPTSDDVVVIGDIDLVKFTDGTVWFSVSGIRLDVTTDPNEAVIQHTHSYDTDFSFSGFFDSSKGEYTKVFKIAAAQNERIRLKMSVSGSSPSVKATVDIDGNWSNDVDRTYTMVAE